MTRSAADRDEAKKIARRLLGDLRRAGVKPPPDQLKRLEEMAEGGDGDDDEPDGD